MKTVAAVLREVGGALALEEVEVAEPGPGEVLVRIAGVGVCHTDLEAAAGKTGLPVPVVLGHEGAGVVERVGAGVAGVAPGDHVVLSFDSCGECRRCRAGRPAYCERFAALNASGLRRDGSAALSQEGGPVHGSFMGQSSFAGVALASERNAVPVAPELPLELLGPLGCSLLTGAGAVLNVLRPSGGASLVVFGAGAVGLAAVMAARAAGCDPVVAVDPRPERRALAAELGAHRVLDTGEKPPAADFAVEAVGTPEVVQAAVSALASPGVCATVGFRGWRNPVTVDQGRLLRGRTLTGVIEGDADPHELIPSLLELHADGRFAFERMITRFGFDEIEAALEAARTGAAVKPVLVL